MNKKSYLMAGGLSAALVLWMASGSLGGDAPAPAAGPAADRAAPSVQVREQRAEPVQRSLTNQGQVEANRSVEVRAETSGRVVEVLAEKGARVQAGQPLVRLAMNDRQARLAKIQALVEQRTQDYEAVRTLTDEGYQSRSGARQAFAALQEARADLEAVRLDIERTTLRAPFAGVLNERPVELGGYVTPGTAVATLVDTEPLKVVVNVAQQDVAQVRLGLSAEITVSGGRERSATVSYIAAAADPGSRTFRVELTMPNPEHALPAGLSAEVRLPVETVQAYFLSPALLSLDDAGSLGVKTVDDESSVRFHPVSVVRTQSDGVWVSGLPAQARLITVGQGYVKAGEKVQAVLTGADGRVVDAIR